MNLNLLTLSFPIFFHFIQKLVLIAFDLSPLVFPLLSKGKRGDKFINQTPLYRIETFYLTKFVPLV